MVKLQSLRRSVWRLEALLVRLGWLMTVSICSRIGRCYLGLQSHSPHQHRVRLGFLMATWPRQDNSHFMITVGQSNETYYYVSVSLVNECNKCRGSEHERSRQGGVVLCAVCWLLQFVERNRSWGNILRWPGGRHGTLADHLTRSGQ